MESIDIPISEIAIPFALLFISFVTVVAIGLKVSTASGTKGYFSRRYLAGVSAVIIITALGYFFFLGDTFRSINLSTQEILTDGGDVNITIGK